MRILHGLVNPVYHRNLRPQNVLLCPDGDLYKPYIVNFEYAKLSDSETSTVMPNVISRARTDNVYIAPEIREIDLNSEVADTVWASADVYSLAVMTVFILTGEEAAGDNPTGPIARAGYDPEFCHLIDQMLGPSKLRPNLDDAVYGLFDKHLS